MAGKTKIPPPWRGGGRGEGEKGFSVREIARALGGKLSGDGHIRVHGVASLEEAGPKEISFAVDPRFYPEARSSKAAAFFLPRPLEGEGRPQIVVSNPYLALARLLRIFHPEKGEAAGISELACVSPEARLEGGVKIYPFTYLGPGSRIGSGTVIFPLCYIGAGVRIGKDCRIYSQVSIREGTRIGNRVIIQDGARIGGDGFGYARREQGYEKIPQVGGVEIEDEVEIGANATVDRATLGRTVVRRGTKIDNLVQIAHNVEVGRNSIMAAQVGIAGSARIGDWVMLGGQVGVGSRIRIGNGAQVAGQSGVMKDVPPSEKVGGTVALPMATWLRIQAILPELPELRREIQELREKLSGPGKRGKAAGKKLAGRRKT